MIEIPRLLAIRPPKSRNVQKFNLSVLDFSSCVLEAQEQDMRSVSMLFGNH
jgi:hypothetical protein